MKRKAAPRKPRRVVLGVGWPWFTKLAVGPGGFTGDVLSEHEGYGAPVLTLKTDDLGNYNRVRLIAEVLK